MEKYQQLASTISVIYKLVSGIIITFSILGLVIGTLFYDNPDPNKSYWLHFFLPIIGAIALCIVSSMLSGHLIAGGQYLWAVLTWIPLTLLILAFIINIIVTM